MSDVSGELELACSSLTLFNRLLQVNELPRLRLALLHAQEEAHDAAFLHSRGPPYEGLAKKVFERYDDCKINPGLLLPLSAAELQQEIQQMESVKKVFDQHPVVKGTPVSFTYRSLSAEQPADRFSATGSVGKDEAESSSQRRSPGCRLARRRAQSVQESLACPFAHQ